MPTYKLKEIGQARFTHWCEVPTEYVKQYIGPFEPKAIKFLFLEILPGEQQHNLSSREFGETVYYVEGGIVVFWGTTWGIQGNIVQIAIRPNDPIHPNEVEYTGKCIIEVQSDGSLPETVRFHPFKEIELIGENAPAQIVLNNLLPYDWRQL